MQLVDGVVRGLEKGWGALWLNRHPGPGAHRDRGRSGGPGPCPSPGPGPGPGPGRATGAGPLAGGTAKPRQQMGRKGGGLKNQLGVRELGGQKVFLENA